MTEQTYGRVQFLGHVLSTTPELVVSVEEMSDWGAYLGDEDNGKDIVLRLSIVQSVLEQLLTSGDIDHSETTLKVFALPEFFWRGIKGAYRYYGQKNDEMYQQISFGLSNIIQNLQRDYSLDHWLFLFGSILTTPVGPNCQSEEDPILAKIGNDYLDIYALLNRASNNGEMKAVRHYLKILDHKVEATSDTDTKLSNLLSDLLSISDRLATKEVYNRCFIWYGADQYAVQKENKSKEDFILNNPSTLEGDTEYYLQTMVNYPSVFSTDNPVETLPYSVFQCGNLKIGVEICLDHSRKRLFAYLSENKISRLDVQIVVSCGMQLKKDSAVTKDGGLLFNCDGEYMLKDAVDGDHCHSQVKRLSIAASTGQVLSPHIDTLQIIPVKAPESIQNMKLYPHGLGQLHVYPSQDI